VLESGASGVATYLRSLNIDEPFIRQSSSNEYYHTDALGSVLTLTDQAGVVQTSYNYEAFGKTTVSGISSNAFQYTGRENDGTGLYYYRARYHSPTSDRFMSEDPILAPYTPLSVGMCQGFNTTVWQLPTMIASQKLTSSQQLNPFVYALNNPIIFDDPSGLAANNAPVSSFPCLQNAGLCWQSLNYPKQRNCMLAIFGLVNSCRQTSPGGLEACRVQALLDAKSSCDSNPSAFEYPGTNSTCIGDGSTPSYWTCIYRQQDR
jgi:RHS repeat-associated protein